MSLVQSIYISAIEDLALPDGTTEGDILEITCRLQVSTVRQDWVDATTEVGKPQQVPSRTTVYFKALEWATQTRPSPRSPDSVWISGYWAGEGT